MQWLVLLVMVTNDPPLHRSVWPGWKHPTEDAWSDMECILDSAISSAEVRTQLSARMQMNSCSTSIIVGMGIQNEVDVNGVCSLSQILADIHKVTSHHCTIRVWPGGHKLVFRDLEPDVCDDGGFRPVNGNSRILEIRELRVRGGFSLDSRIKGT